MESLSKKVLARENPERESETKKLLQEPVMNKPLVDSVSEGEGSKLSIVEACNDNNINRQEDISSARSDILDCDSPCYKERVPEYQSDLSQDDEDNLLPPYNIFTKLEDVHYSNPNHNSSGYGFQEEDHHHALWSWPGY